MRPSRPVLLALFAFTAFAQTKTFKLQTAAGLTLHNAAATPVKFKGKKAIKVTIAPEAAAQFATPPPPPAQTKKGGQKKASQKKGGVLAGPRLAMPTASMFWPWSTESNSATAPSVDLAGEPGPGAPAARAVSLASPSRNLTAELDCFYLRPPTAARTTRTPQPHRPIHPAPRVSVVQTARGNAVALRVLR
jgi:hypothetical protein